MKFLFVLTLLVSSLAVAHESDVNMWDYADNIVDLPNGDILVEYPRVVASNKQFHFSHKSDPDMLCKVVFGFEKGIDMFYSVRTFYKNAHYVVNSEGEMRLKSQSYDDNGNHIHKYITNITCSNN